MSKGNEIIKSIQTPLAPIGHPQMNSGKESVSNAEFGVRDKDDSKK
jgi:hypothetical protein